MRARVVTAAMLAAGVLVAGCASMKTTEWTGHAINDVIKEFGKPNSIVPDGDGKATYVWKREAAYTSGDWYAGFGTSVVPRPAGGVVPSTHKRLTTWTFWVNQDGTIASWNRQEDQVY